MIEKCVIPKCRYQIAAEFKPAYITGEDLESARVVFVTESGQEIVLPATPQAWSRVKGSRLGGKINDQRHSGYDRLHNTNFVVCISPGNEANNNVEQVVAVHRISRSTSDKFTELLDAKDTKDVTVEVDVTSGELRVTAYPPRTRMQSLIAMVRWLEAVPVIKVGDVFNSGNSSMRVKSANTDTVIVNIVTHESNAPTTVEAAIAEKQREIAGASMQE